MISTECGSCGASIVWAITANGRRIPLDSRPMRVFVFVRTSRDREEALVEPSETAHVASVSGFVTHFATCPNAGAHRKRG